MVKNYPAHFFAVMSSFPQYLVCAWLVLLLADTGSTNAAPSGFIEGHFKYLISASVFLLFAGGASIDAVPTGFVEGHLKIVSPKEVELADGSPPADVATVNYAEYPLIILSRDEKKEIARVTADETGNYRVAVPPGDYVLDVQDRRRRHVRAAPQPFTVASNQTVHVDMNIDTGVR